MTKKLAYTSVVAGTSGSDVLFGGTGNELLTGGAGSDIFAILTGYGSDTISDFEAGVGGDILHLQDDRLATFADFLAAATQVGSDTVVALSSTETLTLQNVALSSLVASNVALDDPLQSSVGGGRDGGSEFSPATVEAATIASGGTLELAGAYSGSVTFGGATGTLVLDHSSEFTGKLFNLTGDGNPLSSDQIDLRDVAFGSGTTVSYEGNSSAGVLTISDAQNDTAHLSLVGNYTNSTFTLSSDGHGGTTVIDPPATPFALGVFVGNPNYYVASEEATFEANFNAFSTLMGTKPQYLDQFGDQTQPISQWVGQASWDAESVARSAVLQNVIPVIGLPMSSTAAGSPTADQFYQAFAAGTYDSVLQGMVKAWASNGFTTQIWRPGWEMNVSTMPSYVGNDAATQADWVKAFQHIYTVLHAAGQADGVNIQVMWNPDVTNYSNAGNVIQTAYPGNQYVDILGADVYGDLYPYGSHAQLYDWDKSGQVLNSPNPVYDTSLQQWAADPVNLEHYYTYPASNQWSLDGSAGHATTLQQLIDLAKSSGKPLAIPETGAGNTADGAGVIDNPTFVQWLSQTLRQSGVPISFVNIWDSNGGGKYEFSNASDGKPLEAAAWAEYFGVVSVPTPTVASFSPDSNVVGDGITNSSQITLTGVAVAGSTVEVFDGTAQIGTTTTSASGSWSFVSATLVDGSHSFTVKDVDAAGNVSAASAALNVTIDTVAPGAPVVAFASGSNLVAGGTTNVNQVTLAGTAEASSLVELFDGGIQIGTATADATGAWSFATGTLADGSHAFTGKAADAAGNVSTASASLTMTVDTIPPVAPELISGTPASANTMIVSGTAEAGTTVKLYEGAALLGTTLATSSGTWSMDIGSLAAGPHQLSATATDAAGNLSQLSNVLNAVEGTLVEAAGTTSLTKVGSNFYMSDADAAVTLKFNGEAYVAGQFSNWTPIAAEATSSGYDVAWKNTSTGLYTVWTADSNGNFTSNLLSNVSGTSAAFESIETLFQQDLNGDGVVGLRTTIIEAAGATSLVQAGSNYLLSPTSGGTGPTLKFNGEAYVAGQFSGWLPIGAEATSSGYDVAWKNTSTGVYTVWTADSNGNFTSNLLSNVSGTSAAFESIETLFQQDLNGDGVVGLRTTIIEAAGATSLVQAGSNYLLSPTSGGTGPTLKFNGEAYVAGQFSGWLPIGAEATSSGYDVAWKNTSTGLYTVWTADSNGNFTSNLLSNVSGTTTSLKSIEVAFHQDLNGDGVINTASTVLDIAGKVALTLANMSQPATLEAGATLELTGAASGSIAFKAATGTLILDHSMQFTGMIHGLSGNGDSSSSNILDLKDISFGSGTTATYVGDTSGGGLTVSDAQNHIAHLTLAGNYTNSTFNLSSDGNGGTLVIDPPADGFVFSQSSMPQVAAPSSAGLALSLVNHRPAFDHPDTVSEILRSTVPLNDGSQHVQGHDYSSALHVAEAQGFLLHV
ncbi:Ig-like domain-containing protein [Bradyrhizobium genosp. P]|uniref:Ig-like domain-containing protein n=1 Tax=Bradyrhizobium genosp. P TaxID=83641 RepID=UPI003CF652C1